MPRPRNCRCRGCCACRCSRLTAGMAVVLLTGTLNRVMILELGVPTSLVAAMVAIPVLAAPFRVLVGYRSDTYKSVLGWRRVPYIWLGHADPVRRTGDHAFRAVAFAVADHRAAMGRAGSRGACLPSHRRRHAHGADGRACACQRSCDPGQAAPRRGAVLCDAAGRHDPGCARLLRAAEGFQRDAPHPGDPGRGGGNLVRQRTGDVEAGSARPVAHTARPGDAFLPRGDRDLSRRSARHALAGRGRTRFGGLRDAGRAARTLRRRNPVDERGADDAC